MLFRSNDTATTEIYTQRDTLSLHDALPIAVALLARLNPLAVLLTGTLLGALQAGGAAMQRDAGVPSVLVSIVEAVLILAMVTGAGRSLVERRFHGKTVAPTDDRVTRAAVA